MRVTQDIATAPFHQMAEDVDRARITLSRDDATVVEKTALLLLRSVHLQLLLLDRAARP